MPATQEEMLHICLQSSQVIMGIKDAQGRAVVVNDTLIKLFGRPREEIIGKTVHELHSQKEEADLWVANDKKVRDSGRPMTFKEFGTFKGKRHTYIVHKFPVKLEEYPNAIGTLILDVTEIAD